MIYTEKYVSKMIKEFENGKLYKGDCLEIMKDLADKSVDMILCDLPYGTTACKWDTIIPFEALWEQYERIIRDNGAIVLTASQPFTSKLIMSNIDLFKYTWVWNKTYPANYPLAKKQPMKIHEDVCVFGKGNAYNPIMTKRDKPIRKGSNKGASVFNKGLEKEEYKGKIYEYKYPESIVSFPTRKEGAKIHPTQKPVPLFEYMISTYSKEGDVVIDNCSGSGTTGIAAINTNRNFILIEKDDSYFDLSANRIEEHIINQQGSLF
jgi:site-specific DNA-methyltransferase (adenine-specific)